MDFPACALSNFDRSEELLDLASAPFPVIPISSLFSRWLLSRLVITRPCSCWPRIHYTARKSSPHRLHVFVQFGKAWSQERLVSRSGSPGRRYCGPPSTTITPHPPLHRFPLEDGALPRPYKETFPLLGLKEGIILLLISPRPRPTSSLPFFLRPGRLAWCRPVSVSLCSAGYALFCASPSPPCRGEATQVLRPKLATFLRQALPSGGMTVLRSLLYPGHPPPFG